MGPVGLCQSRPLEFSSVRHVREGYKPTISVHQLYLPSSHFPKQYNGENHFLAATRQQKHLSAQIPPHSSITSNSIMASNNIYEAYTLCFSRDEKHLSYALILIDPAAPKKKIGHLYRLRWRSGHGTEVQVKENFNTVKCEHCIWMPQSFRRRFERIVNQTELPSDHLSLGQTNQGPKPRDEREWVGDIVRETNLQLSNAGYPAVYDGRLRLCSRTGVILRA